jgi:phospholipase A1
MAHKPNYFIFASYTSGGINPEPYREFFDDSDLNLDDIEARFQISIKTPLWVNMFGKPIDIFAAYTNRSFWQVYNDDISSPFRETNHEPEGWIQFRPNWQFWGIRNNVNAIGIVHQSNGRGGTLSRSWNRVYANFVFEKPGLFAAKDTFAFGIKPWIRISEDEEDDDNPDITDYMGHYEFRMAYKINKHVLSMMLRNNLESGFSRGAVEAAWSFPIWKYPYLKGYLQWFNGYGESLIDYNEHNNSIGIGILLTDWL